MLQQHLRLRVKGKNISHVMYVTFQSSQNIVCVDILLSLNRSKGTRYLCPACVSIEFVVLWRSGLAMAYMLRCVWVCEYVHLSIKTFQEPNRWGWKKGMCVFRACRPWWKTCSTALMVLLVLLVDNTGWYTKGLDFSEMWGLAVPWNFAFGCWGVCTHHLIMSILSGEM